MILYMLYTCSYDLCSFRFQITHHILCGRACPPCSAPWRVQGEGCEGPEFRRVNARAHTHGNAESLPHMSTELNVGLLCLALHGRHRGLARFRSGLLRLLQLTIHLAANVHAYPNDGQYKTRRHRSSACDAGDCARTQTVVLSDRGQRRQRRRRWGWQRRRRRRWIWWKKWPSVVKLDGGPCVSPHRLEHHDVFPRRTRFRIDTVATGACPIPASLQQKLRDAASARALPELEAAHDGESSPQAHVLLVRMAWVAAQPPSAGITICNRVGTTGYRARISGYLWNLRARAIRSRVKLQFTNCPLTIHVTGWRVGSQAPRCGLPGPLTWR